MKITGNIASFVLATDFGELPQEVVDRVKDVITERAKVALRIIGHRGSYPQATIISGSKSSLPLVAFANAELINALDFDAIGPLTGQVKRNYQYPRGLHQVVRCQYLVDVFLTSQK